MIELRILPSLALLENIIRFVIILEAWLFVMTSTSIFCPGDGTIHSPQWSKTILLVVSRTIISANHLHFPRRSCHLLNRKPRTEAPIIQGTPDFHQR